MRGIEYATNKGNKDTIDQLQIIARSKLYADALRSNKLTPFARSYIKAYREHIVKKLKILEMLL